MIIQINNKILKKKSNKEISSIILDILNGKFNYRGVIISGNDNYFNNKEMIEIKKCKNCGITFGPLDPYYKISSRYYLCEKCFMRVNNEL